MGRKSEAHEVLDGALEIGLTEEAFADEDGGDIDVLPLWNKKGNLTAATLSHILADLGIILVATSMV